MRTFFGLLAVTSLGISSAAFATNPPTTPATTSSTTTSETAASSSTSTPASTDAKTTTTTKPVDGQVKLVAGDSEADKQLKRLKAAGYKPEVRGGEVVFCRKEAVLGTRFEKKNCNTAEALDRQMTEAQEMASQAQRNSTITPRGN